jgi:hypothetical protein
MMELSKLWDKARSEEMKLELGEQPRPGGLNIRSSQLSTQEEVRQALSEFSGEGWVMLTDRVVDCRAGVELPEGIILAAECAKGERSLHLRQEGSGWQGWWMEHDKEEEGCLFEESFERIPWGRLHYEVHWKPDGEGVWRPVGCRLKKVQYS